MKLNALSANANRTWPRRATLTLACVALVVTIYVVALSFAAPRLVERALAQYVAAAPGRSASLDRVRVDPFALRIELASFSLDDEAAGVSITAPVVLLDFALISLLERRAVLDSATFERPALRVESTNRGAVRQAWMARARIERLEVLDGRLDLVDRAAERERRLGLDRLAILATGIDARTTTTAAGGHYALSAVLAGETQIEIEGTVTPGLTALRGPFTIIDLDVDTVRPWLDPRLDSLALRGRLDITGEYATTASTWPALELRDARVEIAELGFAPMRDWIVQTQRQALVANLVLAPARPARTFRLEIEGGAFELVDARASSARRFAFADVAGALAARPDTPDRLELELRGQLTGAGRAWLRADVVPPGGGPRMFGPVALGIEGLGPPLVNPYAETAIGRTLESGEVDLELAYAPRGGRLDGSLHVVTRGLDLVRADAGVETREVDLAAALLEDPQGVIDVEIDFAQRLGADVGASAASALRRRIAALAAAPLRELGRGLPADWLRAVAFEPGTAALGERAQPTIDALAAALERRPRLGLRVHPGFDAESDRDALAEQQIELHVLLATAGPSPQARPEPVDFGSPRAQDVLEEFASERLPAARLAAIADRLGCDRAVEPCRTAYYAAVFEALVANEPIAEATLRRLGRFRAQSIIAALSERGIAAERLSVGQGGSVSIARGVGLPVEVYVADQPPNTSSPSR